MFRNYLKIAFRNLVRHKGYSFINIAGLAIGITCCLLILIFVQDELMYDKHHKQGKDIYRIAIDARIGNQDIKWITSPAPMAFTLVDEFPEVVQATRIFKPDRYLIQYGDNRFNEERFLFADSTIFNVFTIPMIQGNPKTALTQPNAVVITEEIAEKYFGKENPMDKYLTMEDTTQYMVTGIVENPPGQSHIEFDFFASMSSMGDFPNNDMWVSNSFVTYILLKENSPYKLTEEKLVDLIKKYAGPQIQLAAGVSFDDFLEAGNKYGFFLEPLLDLYLYSELENGLGGEGNVTYVYIFSLIAVFVLLIACINFMNLATARSANRAKEVGIRKVLGSVRSQLVLQFLIESIVLSLIATLVALFFINLLMPSFNNLTGKELEFNLFSDGFSIVALFAFVLFVGILAGSYPGFFLASFQPVTVLQGKLARGMRSGKLRSGLVVFQFTISIILFIGTLVVLRQLEYFQNKDLGFNKDRVIVIPRSDVLENQGEAFKQELLQHSGITNVSFSNTLPGKGFSFTAHMPENVSGSEALAPAILFVDVDFYDTYQLEMATGRFFSREMSLDTSAVIINETAVRSFGLDDPVGKGLIRMGPTQEESERSNIIGVVKDFHFQSLHRGIEPLVMNLMPGTSSYLSIRTITDGLEETIAFVDKKWREFVPDKIFDYYFFEDDYDQLYVTEKRTGRILSTFSILAIFIACLGLFGLSSFTAEQRSKEIGIRKVLGASVQGIVVLLSRETLMLILIGTMIAWPISYYTMKYWLQDFAYRINLSFDSFIVSSLAALFISMVTVTFQAIKAALANPVKSLRYE